MIILVTGASGFVGRVVALESAQRGLTVHGCGSSARQPAGLPGTWHQVAWSQGVQPLADLVAEVSPDLIVHAAGSASVADSLKTPLADLQASLGTWSLLLEATRLSSRRPVLVFPSSAAVYGNPKSLPIPEETNCNPVSPYGWHKVMCENLARSHAAFFGAKIVIARLFSVIGAHQKRLLVWELFDQLQRSAGPVRLMGSGKETRDFLGEREMAGALISLAMNQIHAEPSTEPLVVNLASGREVSTLQIAQLLVDLFAPGREIVCQGEQRQGDPLRWCAEISRLRNLLPDHKPSPIEQTLHQAVAAWQ
jgi:UDP-glucose 4-epimerase